jgi:DNA-binding NarL/FixJ family response regulator
MILERTTKSSRPRVLIADDHPLLAERCKSVLESAFDVVGVAKDGLELVAAAIRLRPDLIVLDISMPFLNGFEAGTQIKQDMPGVKLLFLTAHQDAGMIAEAFRCGASGYLAKTCTSAELMEAALSVLLGNTYVPSSLCKSMGDARGTRKPE